jgi:hypothetical protein
LYAAADCIGESREFRKNTAVISWSGPAYYRIGCGEAKYRCVHHSGCGKFSREICEEWCLKAGFMFRERVSSGCPYYSVTSGKTTIPKQQVKCCCD